MHVTTGMIMGTRKRETMIDVLNRLDYTTNLKLCLDASDHNSWNGSGKWLDISGNGCDFFAGNTAASETQDPTFGGSEMGSREGNSYFTFDNDYFQYDTSNETWMENIHKNNAQYTFTCWIYPVTLAGSQNIMGTTKGWNPQVGFQWRTYYASGDGELSFIVYYNHASGYYVYEGGGATGGHHFLTANTWQFIAISVDLTGQPFENIYCVKNGTSFTNVGVFSDLKTSSASAKMEIGSQGTGVGRLTSGARIGSICAWEGSYLTTTQINNIFEATRGWYGI